MPVMSTVGALSYKSMSPVVSSGLILNYDIQNTASYSGSGTAVVDLVGNSNGTLYNTPTYNGAGTKYVTFNGSNQYLMLNTNLNPKLSPVNTSTVISYFLWVYLQDNGVIVSEQGTGAPPNQGWYDSQIELVSGTLRFGIWNGSLQNFASTIATPLNTWHYVGFTYDGTTLRGYVNGAAAGSITTGRATPYNNTPIRYQLLYSIASNCPTSMGDGTASNMRLGAFHVYNVALTAAQVLANYNNTRASYYP